MGIVRILLFIPLYYLSILKSLLQKPLSLFYRLFSITSLIDLVLSLYFYHCGLSPITVPLFDSGDTSVHFWIPKHRLRRRQHSGNSPKPSIVLIHGYGGNAKWQMYKQIGSLSESFDVYVPDLVFFGNSRSNGQERTVEFQARCVGEGLKRLGVLDRRDGGKVAVFGVSYGGYVAYRIADAYREEVERVVIMSCGICFTEEQKLTELEKIGRDVSEILVPEKEEDLRLLVDMAFHSPPWAPSFVLRDFISVMGTAYKKERRELLKELLTSKLDLDDLPVLSQETLILWGDKDKVFPVYLAYQLARFLGKKSKVEILKDAGHAANLESSDLVNDLIKSFVLGSSTCTIQD